MALLAGQLSRDIFSFLIGCPGEIRQPLSGELFQALGLREERGAEPFGNLALADDAGQSSDGASPPGKSHVGMSPVRKYVGRNDARRVGLGQRDKSGWRRRLFVEHRLERRFCGHLETNGEFRKVEGRFDLTKSRSHLSY